MTTFKEWFSGLSLMKKRLVISGIVALSLIIIVSVIVIGLWQGGVIFKSDDSTTTPTTNCDAGNTTFTLVNEINFDSKTKTLGILGIDETESNYMIVPAKEAFFGAGVFIAYKRNANNIFEYASQSGFTYGENEVTGQFATVSPDSNYTACHGSSSTITREHVYVTERSGDDMFTKVVSLPASADETSSNALISSATFDQSDGTTQLMVGFYDTLLKGLLTIYKLNNGSWEFKENIENPHSADSDAWGGSLSLQGNRLIMGDTAGHIEEYQRSSISESWERRTNMAFIIPDPTENSSTTLIMDKDALNFFVGDTTFNSSKGRVLWYNRSSTDDTWSLNQTITSQNSSTTFFGLRTAALFPTRFAVVGIESGAPVKKVEVHKLSGSDVSFLEQIEQDSGDSADTLTESLIADVKMKRISNEIHMFVVQNSSNSRAKGAIIRQYVVTCS